MLKEQSLDLSLMEGNSEKIDKVCICCKIRLKLKEP